MVTNGYSPSRTTQPTFDDAYKARLGVVGNGGERKVSGHGVRGRC